MYVPLTLLPRVLDAEAEMLKRALLDDWAGDECCSWNILQYSDSSLSDSYQASTPTTRRSAYPDATRARAEARCCRCAVSAEQGDRDWQGGIALSIAHMSGYCVASPCYHVAPFLMSSVPERSLIVMYGTVATLHFVILRNFRSEGLETADERPTMK